MSITRVCPICGKKSNPRFLLPIPPEIVPGNELGHRHCIDREEKKRSGKSSKSIGEQVVLEIPVTVLNRDFLTLTMLHAEGTIGNPGSEISMQVLSSLRGDMIIWLGDGDNMREYLVDFQDVIHAIVNRFGLPSPEQKAPEVTANNEKH